MGYMMSFSTFVDFIFIWNSFFFPTQKQGQPTEHVNGYNKNRIF